MQHRITEHCDGHACKLEYSMGSTGNPVAQPYTNIKTAEKNTVLRVQGCFPTQNRFYHNASECACKIKFNFLKLHCATLLVYSQLKTLSSFKNTHAH